MGLLNRMIKILKDNDNTEAYAHDVIWDYKSLKTKINKAKEIMDTLSTTRRKNQCDERKELAEHLLRVLHYIYNNYETYLNDLHDLCMLININPQMKLTPKVIKQVLYAINTKTELRKEFETIYKNFKSMAKKLNDMPMKEILKRMREIFDFDGTNYCNNKDHNFQSYYDSTTMQIKYIIP